MKKSLGLMELIAGIVIIFGFLIMFWGVSPELIMITLGISVFLIIPLQLLLCFKVKNLVIRLLPMITLLIITVALVIRASYAMGWDEIGYLILPYYAGFMMFMCVVGWRIWARTRR